MTDKCTRCGKENPAEIHTCTPLALRLADELYKRMTLRYMGNCKCGDCQLVNSDDVRNAAAELRRLYEENQRLDSDRWAVAERKEHWFKAQMQSAAQIKKLKEVNAALVEACETLVTLPNNEDWMATLRLAVQQARSALVKAKGESNVD